MSGDGGDVAGDTAPADKPGLPDPEPQQDYWPDSPRGCACGASLECFFSNPSECGVAKARVVRAQPTPPSNTSSLPLIVDVADEGGVWLSYSFDSNGYQGITVHADELSALREAVASGYKKAKFVAYGEELS